MYVLVPEARCLFAAHQSSSGLRRSILPVGKLAVRSAVQMGVESANLGCRSLPHGQMELLPNLSRTLAGHPGAYGDEHSDS